MPADGAAMRTVVLEVIREQAGHLQTRSMLQEVENRLRTEYEFFDGEALLTLFYDLFRSGLLAWGRNLSNPEPPFIHLTERGRQTLQHLSRDPANPDGYLAHLGSHGALNPIADAYVREALETYNAACYRAAAVMIGAAAESLVLELRDVLIARIQVLGRSPNKDLVDWRIKRVLDALRAELGRQKATMPSSLAEPLEAYWPAFTQQIRTVRNDAGHPISVAPVSAETVHGSLLIFPELARLARELMGWIQVGYQ